MELFKDFLPASRLLQLAAAQDGLQLLDLLGRELARFRLDRFRETGDGGRIDLVGFGQAPDRFGKIADLAWLVSPQGLAANPCASPLAGECLQWYCLPTSARPMAVRPGLIVPC